MNYDSQRLEARFYSHRGAQRGTDLHELARQAIRLNVELHESNQALATYVNDAIEFGMECEQPLYYSDNCFGTADSICFYDNILRIHDLKTGISSVSEKQLEVYAAIFCLEYGIDPFDIQTLLRIYQRDEIREYIPAPEWIAAIMTKIVEFDLQLEGIKGRPL